MLYIHLFTLSNFFVSLYFIFLSCDQSRIRYSKMRQIQNGFLFTAPYIYNITDKQCKITFVIQAQKVHDCVFVLNFSSNYWQTWWYWGCSVLKWILAPLYFWSFILYCAYDLRGTWPMHSSNKLGTYCFISKLFGLFNAMCHFSWQSNP